MDRKRTTRALSAKNCKKPKARSKAKKLTLGQKNHIKGELTRILDSILTTSVTDLVTRGVLQESPEGLAVIEPNGVKKHYKIRDNPSDEDKVRNASLALLMMVHGMRDEPNYIEVGTGFLIGVVAAWSSFTVDYSETKKALELLTKHRRLGGLARRTFTPEKIQLAREIFHDLKRDRVSDDAAYRRTIGKLQSEHGISVSRSTLQRHLRKSPNAEQRADRPTLSFDEQLSAQFLALTKADSISA